MRLFNFIKSMNIYYKWLLIVALNAVSGFFWGTQVTSFNSILSMTCGVITWYVIYLSLDIALLKRSRADLSRKLRISASTRILLQILVLPDVYAGMGAIFTLQLINMHANDFLGIYFLTMLTGLYLSIFCAIIFLSLYTIDGIRKKISL